MWSGRRRCANKYRCGNNRLLAGERVMRVGEECRAALDLARHRYLGDKATRGQQTARCRVQIGTLAGRSATEECATVVTVAKKELDAIDADARSVAMSWHICQA